MNMAVKASIGIGALLGSLLGAAPLGAQNANPTCGGLEATIVQTTYVEELFGTNGDDVIVVSYAKVETDVPFSGMISVDARDGNDTICVVGTPDSPSGLFDPDILVVGGEGDDTIYGGSGADYLSGDDLFLEMHTGNDTIYGGPGTDRIEGGLGDDLLFGQQGMDVLVGGQGNDVVHGGQGPDAMAGFAGDDELLGGPGHDFIYGGLGKDTLFGGAGNDALYSNAELNGDLLVAPGKGLGLMAQSTVSDTAGGRMFGGTGNDLLVGSDRWDRMQGGDGNDYLFGLEGRDWMRGGAGNDMIFGGLGIDDVNGNLGADRIIATGADTILGGYGADSCYEGPVSTDAQLRSCEVVDAPPSSWTNMQTLLERTYNGAAFYG